MVAFYDRCSFVFGYEWSLLVNYTSNWQYRCACAVLCCVLHSICVYLFSPSISALCFPYPKPHLLELQRFANTFRQSLHITTVDSVGFVRLCFDILCALYYFTMCLCLCIAIHMMMSCTRKSANEKQTVLFSSIFLLFTLPHLICIWEDLLWLDCIICIENGHSFVVVLP